MGDVHAANPGQQELATHRWHAVIQVHSDPGLAQYFGGHQPGGAATDDRDVRELGWDLGHGGDCGSAK